MSQFIDDGGSLNYILNFRKEDYGKFKSFISTRQIGEFADVDAFIKAFRKHLYEAYCQTVLFPYEFEQWVIFYNRAVTKELRKKNSVLYQYYNINNVYAGHDTLSFMGQNLDIDEVEVKNFN